MLFDYIMEYVRMCFALFFCFCFAISFIFVVVIVANARPALRAWSALDLCIRWPRQLGGRVIGSVCGFSILAVFV